MRALKRWSVVAALAAAALFTGSTIALAAPPAETLFGSSVPKVVSDGETSSVTLGVKFSSKVDGQITGLRFYKGQANTGTHTGALYSSSGAVLAGVTFSPETASGWQTASLASPVNITKGTTYEAAYLAPKGRYAGDNGGFNKVVVSGDLTAPVGAGVYAYGSKITFPKSSYGNTNYYVDVFFVPNAVVTPPPTTPPVTPPPTPDPTPTPTPTPTPPPASDFPSAATTGYAPGTVFTTDTGDHTITTNGVTYTGVDYKGGITVSGSNNTFVNCLFEDKGYWPLRLTGTGNTVTHSTFRTGGGSQASVDAISGNTISFSDVSGSPDGIRLSSNSTVNDNYVHDLFYSGSEHNDAIDAEGNVNMTVRHNTSEDWQGQTSAVTLTRYSGTAPFTNNVIDHNLLAGGGYTIYGPGTAGGNVTGTLIINNHLSKKFFPNYGYWGWLAYEPPAGNGNIISGNVDADTGAAVGPQ